jgi:HAMP domain-containing protein
VPEVLAVEDDRMVRRTPMRIRTQLTLVVTAVVAVAVGIAGLVLVVRNDHRDRDALDRVLATRAADVRTAAMKSGALPTDGSYTVRLIDKGQVKKQVGATDGFPLPVENGYSTVGAGDTDWRSLAEPLVSGAQLQILISLADLKERHTDNVLIVDLLVLLAALISAVGVWFATGLVLRPFQRLLTAVRQLDPADPASRLTEAGSPREVAELAAAVNALLDRTRSVPAPPPEEAPEIPKNIDMSEETEALDEPLADLGTNLDTLLDNPEMPATQRHLILAAMADDHRQLVTLLEAMRAEDIKDLP